MRRFMMLLFKLVPDGQSWRTVQYIWIHFPRIDHFNGDANMPSKVYFTSKNMQKKEAEDLSCFSWKEFALLGSLDREFPRSDICTIMYTSGTTADVKVLF